MITYFPKAFASDGEAGEFDTGDFESVFSASLVLWCEEEEEDGCGVDSDWGWKGGRDFCSVNLVGVSVILGMDTLGE